MEDCHCCFHPLWITATEFLITICRSIVTNSISTQHAEESKLVAPRRIESNPNLDCSLNFPVSTPSDQLTDPLADSQFCAQLLKNANFYRFNSHERTQVFTASLTRPSTSLHRFTHKNTFLASITQGFTRSESKNRVLHAVETQF